MTDSSLAPKRRLNPWLFLVGVSILAFGLLVVFAFVAGKFAPQSGALRDANDHVMTDGTILRIEKVSFGKSHELEHGSSSGGSWWGLLGGARNSKGMWGTSHDRLVVQMSRRHAVTGQSLDFDWWGENVAIDVFGDRVHDSDQVQLFQSGSKVLSNRSSMSSSRRPLKADHSQYDHWIMGSSLPPFRINGDTVTIEVKNTSGEIMVKLDLKHPAPPTLPTWTAEPLPCTKSDGDLGITFKSATIKDSGTRQIRGRIIQSLCLNSAIDLTWKGQPTTDWRQEWMQAVDPSGNSPLTVDYSSPHEKVLKLNYRFVKHRDAKFDPSEQAAGATIRLPASGKSVPLTDTATLGGTTLHLWFVEGSGKTSNPVPSALIGSHGNSSGSYGGVAFQKPSEFKLNTSLGSGTMEIAADFPRLLFEKRGLSARDRLYVHVRDDQGRVVPNEEQDTTLPELQLLFLKPEPDAKSFTLTWTVTTAHEFEFFIEQPSRPPVPETVETE